MSYQDRCWPIGNGHLACACQGKQWFQMGQLRTCSTCKAQCNATRGQPRVYKAPAQTRAVNTSAAAASTGTNWLTNFWNWLNSWTNLWGQRPAQLYQDVLQGGPLQRWYIQTFVKTPWVESQARKVVMTCPACRTLFNGNKSQVIVSQCKMCASKFGVF